MTETKEEVFSLQGDIIVYSLLKIDYNSQSILLIFILFFWLFQWLSSKESICNTGDMCLIPGSGRSPGGGYSNLLQYSCLENPMDRGIWQTAVHGVTKSRTQLKRLSRISIFSVLSTTFKEGTIGTSLLVLWLRLSAPSAGGPGLLPGQGTRSHMFHLRVYMSQLKILHTRAKDPTCWNEDPMQPNKLIKKYSSS